MDIDQLIDAIETATVEREVIVPRRCYYAREGDTDTDTIRYIDPNILVRELTAAAQATGGTQP